MKHCPHWIDCYGERLIGCIECDTTGREAASGREIELLGTARSVA